MRALALTAVDRLEFCDIPSPVPLAGEVVVRVSAAALNHRDVWIKKGQYAGLRFPAVLGSDAVGVVVRAGPGTESWLGRRVIINPAFGWGESPRAQGGDFAILGLPRDGTFAEELLAPVNQLDDAPAHLDDSEAAALPLAGLTAWRAVSSRARVRAGERVLVTGIGGGVALFALQFAVASGASVWVTSSSSEKIAFARSLGARDGFDYTLPDWTATARAAAPGGFDVIVDSAGGPGFEHLVDLAAPGARLVFFGATGGNPPALPLRKIFWRQLDLLGTTMGSPADWQALLAAVNTQRLRPVVSRVFPFAEAADAFTLLESGRQCGKIVLKL